MKGMLALVVVTVVVGLGQCKPADVALARGGYGGNGPYRAAGGGGRSYHEIERAAGGGGRWFDKQRAISREEEEEEGERTGRDSHLHVREAGQVHIPSYNGVDVARRNLVTRAAGGGGRGFAFPQAGGRSDAEIEQDRDCFMCERAAGGGGRYSDYRAALARAISREYDGMVV